MLKVRIKKNDQVLVIGGKDRKTIGKVLRVLPAEGRALVERVNMIKRHTRANPNKQVQGGIVEREAPIHLSNLKVICPNCSAASRLGRRTREDGKNVRYCKKCNANLD